MSDKSGSDSEPEEDYEVEEIRDKRRGEDGEWLYYVKWVGWESDTNTWEPVQHLDECREKLLDFERSNIVGLTALRLAFFMGYK